MYAKTHTYFEHLCLDWLLRLDWGETRQQGRNLPRYRAEMIQVPTTRSPSHLLLRRQEIDRRCRWEQLRTGKAHRRLVRRQRGRAQRQRLAPTSSGPDHPTAAAGLRQKTITTIDATPDDGAEVTVVGTARSLARPCFILWIWRLRWHVPLPAWIVYRYIDSSVVFQVVDIACPSLTRCDATSGHLIYAVTSNYVEVTAHREECLSMGAGDGSRRSAL